MSLTNISKKKIIILSIILINIFVLTFDYPKKIISKLIFSHDLSLLSYSVFSNINDQINFDMTKKKNQKETLLVLNNYVFNFFRPKYLKNLDSGVSWKMLHGSIWCDGVSDIFLRLAEYSNTRVAMVALFDNKGSSPHTINFIDLDNLYIDHSTKIKTKNKDLETKLKKLYPFDSTFNFIPIRVESYNSLKVDKNHKLENLEFMLNNRSKFPGYGKVDEGVRLNLLHNKKFITNINRLPSEYSLISKLSLKIIKVLPKKFAQMIFKFGIFINPELNNEYKQFLYARLEHILLNYDEAINIYYTIAPQSKYYDAARFWIKRIRSQESVLTKYEEMKFNNFNVLVLQ